MFDEIEITPELRKAVADLKVQAMMFNMEIDWDAGKLVPKQKTYEEAFWLTNWKDKAAQADRQPSDYEGGKDGR